MEFTKEQLSELICKHTEKENGLVESTSKCNFTENLWKNLQNSAD